jgi:chemotaxis protein MotB
LMALFIVLWLMNTKKEVQEAVGGYFRDPAGYAKHTGTGQAGTGSGIQITKDNIPELKKKLEEMRQQPQFQAIKDNVEITVTAEGLLIELLENEKGVFFDSGSPHPSPQAQLLLGRLAQELGKLPNNIVVEGHTDSRLYSGSNVYSNWELSTERANSARRVMQDTGVRTNQIKQVRGFADQRLRKPTAPDDPSNRRITIIVQFETPPDPDKAPEKPPPAKHGAGT